MAGEKITEGKRGERRETTEVIGYSRERINIEPKVRSPIRTQHGDMSGAEAQVENTVRRRGQAIIQMIDEMDHDQLQERNHYEGQTDRRVETQQTTEKAIQERPQGVNPSVYTIAVSIKQIQGLLNQYKQ